MDQPNQPLIPIEEQFKIMADTAPVLIWISGTDKLCYFFNAGWLQFTGQTVEQEYGNGWTKGIHPDDIQRYLDIYHGAFDAREGFKMEYRLRRHDEQYRWLVNNGVPRYTANGSFAGYIGSCMDIHELMESERVKNEYISHGLLENQQALNEELVSTNEELATTNEELAATNEELIASNDELQQSRESLFSLNKDLENRVAQRTAELLVARSKAERQRDRITRFFMQAPAGICVLDGPDFVFELVNPSYQQLFQGRSLLGKSLLQALPELTGGPIPDILKEVYQSGKSFEGNELLVPFIREEDGTIEDRFFNFIYQARQDEKDNIDGILVFVIEVTDIVLTKHRIEESERDLRRLIMTSRYALLILRGPEMIVEVSNQQMNQIWNRPSEETAGRPLMEIFPELEGQPFPILLKKVYEEGVSYVQEEEELNISHSDGQVKKYVSFSYDPLLDNDGEVCGIIVSADDVTEKVKARMELIRETNEKQKAIDRLKANEKNIKNMVRQAPVGMCIVKGDPLFVEEVNDSFLELIGKTREELRLKSYWEVNAEIAGFYNPITDKVLKTGETYHANEHEVMLIRNGKEEIVHVDFVFEPIKDVDGKAEAIMIVAIDVTDKVFARKKVERAEESLRMAIEAAELGSYYINAADRIFVASPRLKEFFGFEPHEEVPYEAAINQIHPDYRQAAADLVEASFTKGVRFDMEYPVVGYHDGRIRWVRGIGTMQHDSDGKSYFTGVLHEITEKKQDEQRKNDFIAMVSHELKTPLTTLTALVQLLDRKLKENEDAFVAGALDKAHIQVKKMSTMINGFLNVSRLESGKIQLDKKDFNLDELVKDNIEDTSLIMSSHIITLLQCKSMPVCADRDKIGSVISNLLSNAVKYSPNGKFIEVKCEEHGNTVQVSVKDDGIGIKPKDRERLFDRYYRVESKHTQHISGFGIGLYLSAEIIQRHDGKIWVESEKGKGSTFYFSLPLPENS